MTIFEYLSNTTKNRLWDKSFIRWYQRTYGATNSKRKRDEWEKIYAAFLSETEENPHVPSVSSSAKETLVETIKETNSKGDK